MLTRINCKSTEGNHDMFGKLFTSLYTGSMIGAGPVPFALMPYVIANARPDRRWGGYVELNPKLLSVIFGCSEAEVEQAIEFLCSPDPRSRTPAEEGRRLVKLGPYDYRVVNYERYRAIRDEEQRREQNRVAQEVYRGKKAKVRSGIKGGKSEVGLKDVEDQSSNGHIPGEPEDVKW